MASFYRHPARNPYPYHPVFVIDIIPESLSPSSRNAYRLAPDYAQFLFDSVQMPVNVMDYHFRSFTQEVLPELVKRNIGALGMKSIGDSVILKSGAVTGLECLQFSLSQPVCVQITGIDKPSVLDQAIEAANTYDKVSKVQMAAILARTKPHAAEGKYELFKTSALFDSTAQHPEWLGDTSSHVKAVQPPMS